MKYDLRKIMLRAWRLYRENKELSFGECLHRAWLSAKAEEVNARRIEAAKPRQELRKKPIHGMAGRSWGMKSFTGARPCSVLI